MSSFRTDGTYSFDFFTDYHVPTKTGRWNLQRIQGHRFLCQDDGGRSSITINDDGTITLCFGKLYPPSATGFCRPSLLSSNGLIETYRTNTSSCPFNFY